MCFALRVRACGAVLWLPAAACMHIPVHEIALYRPLLPLLTGLLLLRRYAAATKGISGVGIGTIIRLDDGIDDDLGAAAAGGGGAAAARRSCWPLGWRCC